SGRVELHQIDIHQDITNECRVDGGSHYEEIMSLNGATTSSLQALQSYTQGVEAVIEKDDESLPYFKRAVELDPNFARAYAMLGFVYQNINQASRGVENFRKAYQVRDRASERERFFIEATYYAFATGELEKASQNYTLALQ